MSDRPQAHGALRAALEAADVTETVLGNEVAALAMAVADTATPDLAGDTPARFLLGLWHWERFKATGGEKVELDLAADLWEIVGSDVLPPEVVGYVGLRTAERLTDLAVDQAMAYEETRDLTKLDSAIESFRAALRAASDPDGLAGRLSNLGSALETKFEHTLDPDVLDEAVTTLRRAVDVTPAGSTSRPMVLSNLGVTLHSQYGRTGDRAVLGEAVDTLRAAVDAAPEGHLDLGMYLANLGSALQDRFEVTTHAPDARNALVAFDRAVRVLPGDHPERAACLASLGNALRWKYELTGDWTALKKAIRIGYRSVQVAGEGVDLALCLSNLGNALQSKHQRTGAGKTIDQAVEVLRRAVELEGDGPSASTYLSNLGGVVHGKFRRTGETEVLDEAIDVLRRAVDATRADDPKLGTYLSNLGNAVLDRYQGTGDTTVLDDAVGILLRAVEVFRADDPRRRSSLINLGTALQCGYDRDGDTSMLDAAVSFSREAVAATPEGSPDAGMYLSNLGSALHGKYERTGDPAVLDEAVGILREAVNITPADHPEIGMYLSNLGIVLRKLVDLTDDPQTLDAAVDALRGALSSVPESHPDAGMYRTNLANALRTRFEYTGERAWLDEAVGLHGDATGAPALADHPDRGGHLFNLGCALWTRFDHAGGEDDLARARASFTEAWSSTAGPVDARVAAADRAADTALAAGDPIDALTMSERAVALLGLLAPRRLPRADRSHRITALAGIAATAATAAIAAGEPEHAVELLEQTRGLLITDTLDTRGDITSLHRHDPVLAAEFTVLREELDTIDHSRSPHDPLVRDRVVGRWEDVLARIRAIPRFAHFLRPPPIQSLRRAAGEGPVVYVVVHRFACHALVLRDDPDHPVDVVTLPGLTSAEVYEQANLFLRSVSAATDAESPEGQVAALRRMRGVLAWTWDAITGPVLDHLGHIGAPPDGADWPRVWWCPVGPATYLPLHAAGHHPETRAGIRTSVDTAMDRVISSYTPTARALLHAAPAPNPAEPRVLVVTAPDALNTHLPNVATEIDHLLALVPTATVLPPSGALVTHDTVLTALPSHSVVHLACHSLSDWTDPARSRLALDDHETHPLTVADVTALHLEDARLAYLSACSTNDTNPRHADEATHLTAAFHLAGYRAVIGTLWPVHDAAAASITRATYRHLTAGGTAPLDLTRTASSLHRSLRSHRARFPANLTSWAAHIHTGR